MIVPNEVVSASTDCPRERNTSIESLVKGVQRQRKMYVKDKILSHSPLVRMFFRTGEGHDQTPMVTGHLVRTRAIEVDGMNDMLEITIRVNADQAAQLPFVEVYDA